MNIFEKLLAGIGAFVPGGLVVVAPYFAIKHRVKIRRFINVMFRRLKAPTTKGDLS